MKEVKKYSIVKPDPTLQNNLMAFGFECGAGWHPLIVELLDELQAISDKEDFDLEVLQVKEKFGELRVYVNYETDVITELIDKYSKRSRITCEVCGEVGSMRKYRGWLYVGCEKHVRQEQCGHYVCHIVNAGQTSYCMLCEQSAT